MKTLDQLIDDLLSLRSSGLGSVEVKVRDVDSGQLAAIAEADYDPNRNLVIIEEE